MRPFVFLVLLLVLALGLGFYLGWFNFTSDRSPTGDEFKVSLGVNTDRIKEDAAEATNKAKKVGQSVKEKVQALAGAETAKGEVIDVEVGQQQFTLRTAGDKPVTIQLNATTKVRVKDKEAGLKDLQAGDQVTVVYKMEDGKNVARSVTVTPRT